MGYEPRLHFPGSNTMAPSAQVDLELVSPIEYSSPVDTSQLHGTKKAQLTPAAAVNEERDDKSLPAQWFRDER